MSAKDTQQDTRPERRDLMARPYTPDEVRVVEWMARRCPDIGAGDDPIGFLIASYDFLIATRQLEGKGRNLING